MRDGPEKKGARDQGPVIELRAFTPAPEIEASSIHDTYIGNR